MQEEFKRKWVCPLEYFMPAVWVGLVENQSYIHIVKEKAMLAKDVSEMKTWQTVHFHASFIKN